MVKKEPESRSLAGWDPFRELELFRGWSPFRELEGFFGSRAARGGRWLPAVEIGEDEAKYTISVELPGAKREDVSLEVEDHVLCIRGEKKSEREEKKEKRHFVERSYGSFSRSFTLPANAAVDRMSASFKDGVLTIEVPKTEEAKPKQIAIK